MINFHGVFVPFQEGQSSLGVQRPTAAWAQVECEYLHYQLHSQRERIDPSVPHQCSLRLQPSGWRFGGTAGQMSLLFLTRTNQQISTHTSQVSVHVYRLCVESRDTGSPDISSLPRQRTPESTFISHKEKTKSRYSSEELSAEKFSNFPHICDASLGKCPSEQRSSHKAN